MEETVRRETAERERTAEKRWGSETDSPLSAGNVTDEQTESVRRHRSIFSQIGQGSLPWPWSWDSSSAIKKKDKDKVRMKAALMKNAVSFLRYAMIPPFNNRNNNRNKKAHVLKAVRSPVIPISGSFCRCHKPSFLINQCQTCRRVGRP